MPVCILSIPSFSIPECLRLEARNSYSDIWDVDRRKSYWFKLKTVCSHISTRTKMWNEKLGNYFKILLGVNEVPMLTVWKKVRLNSVWKSSHLGYFTIQANIKENNILTTRESSHTKIIEHCFELFFVELGKKRKRKTNVPSGVMMGRYDLTKRRVQRLVPAGHGERRTCCIHSSLWQILPQSHKREQEMFESN